MWGPKLTPLSPSEGKQIPKTCSANENGHSTVTEQNEKDLFPTEEETHFASNSNSGDPVSSDESRFVHVPAILRPENDTYRIKYSIVAKCLSLLLDASGITSHPGSRLDRTLTNVPAPVLLIAIRNTMNAYRDEHKVTAKGIKCSSLLPKELRDQRVKFPLLQLRAGEKGYRTLKDDHTVRLVIRKPDRNKKDLHFALFCVLSQVDLGGFCETELEKMAKNGFESDGCSFQPGNNCGGPEFCTEQEKEPACKFLMRKRRSLALASYFRFVPIFLESPYHLIAYWQAFKNHPFGKEI